MQITLNVADSTRDARCCHTLAKSHENIYEYVCVCVREELVIFADWLIEKLAIPNGKKTTKTKDQEKI